MRFDIAHTLEIPQGATELTTSQLEQISGGHGGYKQKGCKYGQYGKKGGKKGGKQYGKQYGYSGYGEYGGNFKQHEYGYGEDCDY